MPAIMQNVYSESQSARQTAFLVQNVKHQNNLVAPTKKLCYAANREGVAEHFTGSVQKMVQADLNLIDHFDEQLRVLELNLERHAKVDDPHAFFLLKSVPGIGKILGLVMLYEIHDINRFPERWTVPFVRTAGPLHSRIGRQASWIWQQENWERNRWLIVLNALLAIQSEPFKDAIRSNTPRVLTLSGSSAKRSVC